MLDCSDYEDGGGSSDEGEIEVDIYSCGHCPKHFTERRNLKIYTKTESCINMESVLKHLHENKTKNFM